MILKHKKMEHIELYIGLRYKNISNKYDSKLNKFSRNNKNMKMVHKNLKNGLQILNILVIGNIIKKMDLVYNFMVMETNMK